jgi:hypothetical protein
MSWESFLYLQGMGDLKVKTKITFELISKSEIKPKVDDKPQVKLMNGKPLQGMQNLEQTNGNCEPCDL